MKSDDDFRFGFIAGALITALAIAILNAVFPPTPDANEILHDYKIDTTTIIHNTDTTYQYKFVKFK